VPGGSRVQLDLGGTTVVGACDALGGMAPGTPAAADLACERAVLIG
jgi:hypothetical protein